MYGIEPVEFSTEELLLCGRMELFSADGSRRPKASNGVDMVSTTPRINCLLRFDASVESQIMGRSGSTSPLSHLVVVTKIIGCSLRFWIYSQRC